MSVTTQIPLAFAVSGSKTPIDVLRTDGVVDFTNGYTADYSRELGVDPSAKPVERDKQNYLFNLITSNLIDWQSMGFPQWISGLPYAVGAFVRYSPNIATTPERIYRCIVANTGAVAPVSSSNWEELLTMAALQAAIPMPEKLVISVATDFNTLTSNATWEIQTDSIASGSPNSPSSFAGMLEVKNIGGANAVIVQRYIDRQGKVFFRGAQSGTWVAWQSTTGLGYTPANAATTITANNGLTGGGDLSANRTIGLANIAAFNILANPTNVAAFPQPTALSNGIVLAGSAPGSYTLGLGAITPTNVTTSVGSVTAANGQFASGAGSTTAVALGTAVGVAGSVLLQPNGIGNTTNQANLESTGRLNVIGLQTGAVQCTSISPSFGATQGFQFAYNSLQAGVGRNEYVNNFGSGSGGHLFYSRSAVGGAATLNATIDATGNVLAQSSVYAASATFFGNSTAAVLCPNGSGTVYLRPSGPGSVAGQLTVNTNGCLGLQNGSYNPSGSQTLAAVQVSGSFGGGVALIDPAAGGNGSYTLFTSSQTFFLRAGPANGAPSAAGFSLDSAGNFIGTGIIRPGSDERVKADWEPITNAVETIEEGLQGFLYHRLDDNGRLESGFGAQTLKANEKLSHLVTVGETPEGGQGVKVVRDGEEIEVRDFHHVGYDNVVPYTTTAIIELSARTKKQEARIAELERQLEIVLKNWNSVGPEAN